MQKGRMRVAHGCQQDQVIIEHEVPEADRLPSRICPQRYEGETESKLCKSFGSEAVHFDGGGGGRVATIESCSSRVEARRHARVRVGCKSSGGMGCSEKACGHRGGIISIYREGAGRWRVGWCQKKLPVARPPHYAGRPLRVVEGGIAATAAGLNGCSAAVRATAGGGHRTLVGPRAAPNGLTMPATCLPDASQTPAKCLQNSMLRAYSASHYCLQTVTFSSHPHDGGRGHTTPYGSTTAKVGSLLCVNLDPAFVYRCCWQAGTAAAASVRYQAEPLRRNKRAVGEWQSNRHE